MDPNLWEYKSEIDWYDCFLIILFAIMTSLLSEGFSWVLIYRTAEYKDIKKQIEILTKKIEKKKELLATNMKPKNYEKKLASYEQTNKSLNQKMSKVYIWYL